MAREPRDEVAGGTFHVTNRGNRKQRIFEDERDRQKFLKILIEERQTHDVVFGGGCQMGNHFHLIVSTPYGNLSDFVGAVEARYAEFSNWRHGNVGHLFQGRYRGIHIEDDVQLLTALCYVFLNPVSAGVVTRIEDYHWSTYRATVGLAPVPQYLSLTWLRTLFPGESLVDAQRSFRRLMDEAEPVFAYFQRHDEEIDSDAAKRVIRSYVGEQLCLARLPHLYRSVLRPKLSELLPPHVRESPEFAERIYEARATCGYRVVEIARHLRVNRAAVTRAFRAACRTRERS